MPPLSVGWEIQAPRRFGRLDPREASSVRVEHLVFRSPERDWAPIQFALLDETNQKELKENS